MYTKLNPTKEEEVRDRIFELLKFGNILNIPYDLIELEIWKDIPTQKFIAHVMTQLVSTETDYYEHPETWKDMLKEYIIENPNENKIFNSLPRWIRKRLKVNYKRVPISYNVCPHINWKKDISKHLYFLEYE